MEGLGNPGKVPAILLFDLFSGIKAGRLALSQLPVKVINDLDSEVSAFATSLREQNWPGTISLGNIETISKEVVSFWIEEHIEEVDVILILGGVSL